MYIYKYIHPYNILYIYICIYQNICIYIYTKDYICIKHIYICIYITISININESGSLPAILDARLQMPGYGCGLIDDGLQMSGYRCRVMDARLQILVYTLYDLYIYKHMYIYIYYRNIWDAGASEEWVVRGPAKTTTHSGATYQRQ